MKTIYLLLISFFLYSPAKAQLGYGKPKDILEIKKRPLIIMLEAEDRKLVDKYAKKPEKLMAYQKEIADLNQGLRALGDHWEFNDDIQFMEYREIRQLQKKKKNNFAVLYIQRMPVKQKFGQLDNNQVFDGVYRITGDLSLTLIEKWNKKKPVTTFSLSSPYPDKGNLVSTGRILVTYMNDRLAGKRSSDIREDIKTNAHRLPNKILLLDQEMLDKNFKVDKIKNHYPYPTLVTDSKTIEEAILRKDPKFAFITIVPMKSGATQNLHLVIDAENSQFLGYSTPQLINLTINNDSKVIYSRHLENYHKLIK